MQTRLLHLVLFTLVCSIAQAKVTYITDWAISNPSSKNGRCLVFPGDMRDWTLSNATESVKLLKSNVTLRLLYDWIPDAIFQQNKELLQELWNKSQLIIPELNQVERSKEQLVELIKSSKESLAPIINAHAYSLIKIDHIVFPKIIEVTKGNKQQGYQCFLLADSEPCTQNTILVRGHVWGGEFELVNEHIVFPKFVTLVLEVKYENVIVTASKLTELGLQF